MQNKQANEISADEMHKQLEQLNEISAQLTDQVQKLKEEQELFQQQLKAGNYYRFKLG